VLCQCRRRQVIRSGEAQLPDPQERLEDDFQSHLGAAEFAVSESNRYFLYAQFLAVGPIFHLNLEEITL
jgi:hypothetical protein